MATIPWLEVLENQYDIAITDVVCLLHINTRDYTKELFITHLTIRCVVRALDVLNMKILFHDAVHHPGEPLEAPHLPPGKRDLIGYVL